MEGQKVKERQIKIYRFDRDSISEGELSSEELESRIITLINGYKRRYELL